MQVWIPAYHGGNNPDTSKIGTQDELGEYPWAQICTVNFNKADGLWGGILSTLGTNKLPIIYPEVGDTVYIKFEQGDVRFPIYMGSHTTGDDLSLINADNPSTQYTIQKLATDMILANESGAKYNAVNWNDNGGISVGLFQWHNSRAKEVFVIAKEKNTNEFNSILNKHNASDFSKQLDKNVSWNNWLKADKGSSWGKAILEILNSSCGKQAQDSILSRDIGKYVNQALDKGYIDVGSIMFYADILNKMGNMKRFNNIKTSSCTYVTIYNEACKKIPSAVNRWSKNKTYIDNLIKQGTLIKESNGFTSIKVVNQDNSNNNLFMWPVPNYTNITKNYSTSSKYINISGKNIIGANVISSHNGNASFKYNTTDGNYIEIEYTNPDNDIIISRYKHLNSMIKVKNTTVRVNKGTKIGTVGQTGNALNPTLKFELEINGSLVNPISYLSTSSLSNGNTELFNKIYNEAKKHLGKKYIFGTQGPSTFDCSGFIWYVYKKVKLITWGRTNVYNIYHKHTTPVKNGQQQPGDLVFFKNTYKQGLSHIGIYIGNGRMIHAGNPINETTVSSYGNKLYGYGKIKPY